MKIKSILLLTIMTLSYSVSAKDMSCNLNQEGCSNNAIIYLPVRNVSSINDLDKSERFLLEDSGVKTGEVVDRRESIEFNSLEPISLPPVIIESKKETDMKLKIEEDSNEIDYIKNPPALQLHSKSWNKIEDIEKNEPKKPIVKPSKTNLKVEPKVIKNKETVRANKDSVKVVPKNIKDKKSNK